MEKYLIDYEIDRSQEGEIIQPGKDQEQGRKDQEQAAEKAEKAREAQNRYNATWQKKEYEQINVKLPRGIKKAFLAACRERGISGRQYLIECMEQIIKDEIGVFDLEGEEGREEGEGQEEGRKGPVNAENRLYKEGRR